MNTGSVSVDCLGMAGAVTLTPAWSNGDTRLTLTHAGFTSGDQYFVTISAAQDVAGNDLTGLPYMWGFTAQ